MKLTKKLEKEIFKIYDTWLHSYLNGDVETYNSFLDKDYHFIGSTNNEEFLNRIQTTNFFRETADQFSGKTDLRNETKILEKFENLIILTHVFDAWFLNEGDWTYYGRFRFTSTLHEKKEGWRFIYQHFSTTDSRAEEGDTIGYDKVSAENLQLREAIKRRTVELEQKNRELEIEAALERVRARALAMQDSSELQEVIHILHKEFKRLKVAITGGVFVAINDEIKEEINCWGSGGTTDYMERVHLPFLNSRIYTELVTKIKKGPGFFTEEFSNQLKKKFFNHLFKQPAYAKTSDQHKKEVMNRPGGYVRSCSVSKNTSVFIINHHGIKFSDKDNEILRRFGKVFEQTYTRFLDLKHAEDQTREAQIELGLERVRARSMAMHEANELADTAMLLFEQVTELGIVPRSCGFLIMDDENEIMEDWSANVDEYGKSTIVTGTLNFNQHPLISEVVETWRRGDSYFIGGIHGEALQKYYQAVTVQESTSKAVKSKVLAKMSSEFTNSFYFEYGMMYVLTPEPISDDEINILIRFASVFKLTYRRFLDIQTAEAQTREVQIELALERVRARTMSMQESHELGDVAIVLFKELNQLVENLWTCGFVLCEKDREEDEWWLSTEEGFIPPLFLPNIGDDTHHNIYEAWKNGDTYHTVQLEGDALQKHYDWLMTIPVAKDFFDDMLASGLEMPNWQKLHCAYFSYGYLVMITRVPCPEEAIFKRFAKVFDQTYSRFLDLQKAEAQAKEAQIEVALERVRSRSMAMHGSNELKEVIKVIFDQMTQLNINAEHAGIVVDYEPKKDFHFWVADAQDIPSRIKVPYLDLVWDRQFTEAKKSGKDFFTTHLDFEEKNSFYKELLPHIKGLTKKARDFYFNCPGLAASTVIQKDIGLYIENFSGIPYTDEENSILSRIGKVFQQTYTRFLDLQRAEAQTRESQIEAALERTRNQSMQMQHSDEIKDLSKIFHEQLHVLKIPSEFSYVWLPEEDKKEHMFWATWTETSKGSSTIMSKSVIYPLDRSEPYTAECYRAWKSEDPVHETKILPEETVKFFDAWKELLKGAKKLKARYFPEGIYYSEAYMKYGCFGINIRRALQNDEADVLHRFAIEFERAYTRFLDLKKAEAQTRESQIEAALERVRSKTMAMHNSRDVKETVKTFFDEILKLGIDKSIRCGIGILEGHEGMETWSANAANEGGVEMRVGILNMTIHPMLRGLKKAWKNGEKEYSYYYTKKDVLKYYTALNDEPEYPFNANLDNLPKREYHNSFFFSSGIIFAFAENPMTEESSAVLHRFAEVFGQTYRRFLDLRKAEAQSREAQIELALERVRNRAMSMMKSDELGDFIITVFKELQGLDMQLTRCLLWIFNEDDQSATAWMTNSEDPNHADNYHVLYHDHPAYKNYLKGWEAQLPEWEYHLKGKNKDKWDEILVEGFFKRLPRKVKNAMKAPERVILSGSFNKYGLMQTAGLETLSDANKGILKRFSQVFEQNYNRFLDLKKAEKQAHEAQIEAALEKVRARTMAMQSSHELQDAANLLFLEVQRLGINAWSAGYNILNEDKTQSVCWMSSEGELQDPFPLFFTKETSFKAMGKFLKSDETFFVQELKGKALVRHYDYMKSLPELKETFQHIVDAGLSLPTYQINHLCKFSQGFLLFITYESVPDAHDIFKRFTKVFEQTYTRFLDLQKAESQTKEAQIELALERVRASTMAMHKSEQLAETAQVLFEQFHLLGTVPDRISIAIYNEQKRIFELWATDQSGRLVDHVHNFSIEEPTCMAKTFKAWKAGKETYVLELKGKDLEKWIHYVKEEAKMKIDISNLEGRRVQHTAYFSEGYLMLSSHFLLKEETLQLLSRFAKVFQQTYTRFLDLKKAELQAREAIKHASVDRVRAEIASMRTTADLKRITPLVWNELTTLDVPFVRCGVFIMDEEKQEVQTHLSTPDGKAIASFELPFEDTAPLTQLLPRWKKKEMYTDHWDKAAFIESTEILMNRGAISSTESYITENQPANLHLHFLPFLQGMLYVGSEVPLTEDELSLVQNLADAFSAAYSRYEDFNKLELANKKIEKTLDDLKQTQSQLIQSEKMASLGELTAGIAHEIQNPLNFVNNFSEVSHELLSEMKEELDKGDLEEVREITSDIEQNLEKINHHGQRASDIVKGMLQHSRTSSGVKEPTDINALADEYLRLAYHGLRAKDKSFNVKMETDFEKNLEKIKVVPQDIGRVVLNLITNAFHAVSDKKKASSDAFDPTVKVSTKKLKGMIEIKVADNGNGIPKKVLDKIFQPFFTTKPTGHGTGLGLSLSYDIVKAHGGELKVMTEVGKGTEFKMILAK